MKTINEAQWDLEYEINEEAVKQIELGYGKWAATERAAEIVRQRRERRASGLADTLKGEK